MPYFKKPSAIAIKAGAFALLLATCGALFAQPATEPLLTRSASVRPNLLMMLDTSGSMAGTEVYARHYELATGSCSGSGTSSANAKQSPVNNLLTYDPSKRYEPAFDNDGNQLANASVSTYFSALTVYLPKSGQNIPGLATRSEICKSNRYDAIQVQSTRFNVNGTNTTTYPFATSPNRTDCAGGCTLVDEKQNIANWNRWHSTRMDAAKVGTGKAFTAQPDTFRLGYTTIYPGGSGLNQLTGVKDFNLAKTEFFTWLNSLQPTNNTPLRKALDAAGQYYSRTDKNGPWAHSPWKTNSEGEAIKDQLSCRRNYTILITDGEWNDAQASTAAARNDVDSSNGPNIVHANGTISYQYKPKTTDPRSVGKADKISGSGFSNTLADVAMYYWVNDLRTDLTNDVTPGRATDKPFWQNMTTYTGAFGPVGALDTNGVEKARLGQQNWTTVQPVSNATETIDDLIHAAHNGGGDFLTLTDASSFAAELGRVVGSIAGDQFSQAGVAASAVALTAGVRKFVPYFISNLWWGNLKMINLAANGDEQSQAWEVIETDNLGKPTGVTRIPSPATRSIYTWANNTVGAIPFTKSALNGQNLIAGSVAANSPFLMSNTTTSDMVDFLRGDRSNEGENKPYRKREAILGDITNSTPVFIKNNSNFKYEKLPATVPGVSLYGAYMTSKAARAEGVLMIGANDGMLHAFREGTATTTGGQEVFAFIPRGVLGNLHMLADKGYQHRFFVDGPMVESDAYIMAPSSSGSGKTLRWANLVLGTTAAGGRSVFAVDATRPLQMNDKSVLWEINPLLSDFTDVGNVMSEVQTGITTGGQWVAIFGNGPYGNSGRASLFVVDLATGALIRKLDTNTATGNGLGGVRVVRNNLSQIVGAYAGDLKGNMWRFDLSANTANTWASGSILYTATGSTGKAQSITAAPGVIPRTDGKPGYMVVFGTGKLYDETDQANTDPQSAYGIWDNSTFGATAPTAATKSLLVAVGVNLETENVSPTNPTNPDAITSYFKTSPAKTIDWNTDRGWYINYAITPGQRTVYSVEPLQEVVRIDTIAPRLKALSCSASTSIGNNYLVSPLTGTCKSETTLDTNNDGVIDEKDSVACIYSTEADGEDVVLDIVGADGNSTGIVDIQDSRGHFKARVGKKPPPIPPNPVASKFRRDWRQVFLRPN